MNTIMEVETIESFEYEGQRFELQYEKEDGKVLTAVYACEDFFGYPVTIAERLELSLPHRHIILHYTFRAAICGEGDPYSKSTGVNIALGRIEQAEGCDIVLGSSLEHGESATSLAENFTEVKLDRLKEYIEAKKSAHKVMENRKQLNHKILGRKFEEFK